jgi:hypothetical protein
MKAKAPAVQYVKICSLYGAGYYYIPGTDTCLKIGGFIRVDAIFGPTAGPFESVDFNVNWDAPGAIHFNTRTRAYITFDARTQTEYGTLRSYAHIGGNIDNQGATAGYMDRAFIQLAGFTWGLTDSIFDAYSITPFHMNYVAATNGSIGATGIWQWRYTAQFGGGFSASVAIEDPRRRDVNAALAGTTHAGDEWPDVIGQIEARGPWGAVSAAVAVRDATIISGPNTTISDVGWAAMVGGFFNVPGLPGDTFGVQLTYANGATGYVTGNLNTVGGIFSLGKGSRNAQGLVADGISFGGVYRLATAWGAEAGYEHAWSKTLKTSLVGGIVSIEYDNIGGACLAGICDTKVWNVGSRTTWSPVQNLSLGVDIMYTHVDDFGAPGVANYVGKTRGDVDVWTGLIRVQRVFWP